MRHITDLPKEFPDRYPFVQIPHTDRLINPCRNEIALVTGHDNVAIDPVDMTSVVDMQKDFGIVFLTVVGVGLIGIHILIDIDAAFMTIRRKLVAVGPIKLKMSDFFTFSATGGCQVDFTPDHIVTQFRTPRPESVICFVPVAFSPLFIRAKVQNTFHYLYLRLRISFDRFSISVVKLHRAMHTIQFFCNSSFPRFMKIDFKEIECFFFIICHIASPAAVLKIVLRQLPVILGFEFGQTIICEQSQ